LDAASLGCTGINKLGGAPVRSATPVDASTISIRHGRSTNLLYISTRATSLAIITLAPLLTALWVAIVYVAGPTEAEECQGYIQQQARAASG